MATTAPAPHAPASAAHANAKVMYTCRTHTTGGPGGATRSSDGFLDLSLAAPHGPHPVGRR